MKLDFDEMLSLERQQEIVSFCHQNSLHPSEHWLVDKNRLSYITVLRYQHAAKQFRVAKSTQLSENAI